MSHSVDCLRHANHCAALAEKATDGATRAAWVRMRLRWLRRADVKRSVTTLSRTAETLTFKGQPQLSLGSQPIERLRPAGLQPTHQHVHYVSVLKQPKS